MIKNLPAMQETRVWSLDREDPLEKGMANRTPVFLPGKSHGQRSLAGYSPWGHKELDMTEWLTLSLCRHDWLNHWPLLINLISSPSPLLRGQWVGLKVSTLCGYLGLSGDQPPCWSYLRPLVTSLTHKRTLILCRKFQSSQNLFCQEPGTKYCNKKCFPIIPMTQKCPRVLEALVQKPGMKTK